MDTKYYVECFETYETISDKTDFLDDFFTIQITVLCTVTSVLQQHFHNVVASRVANNTPKKL